MLFCCLHCFIFLIPVRALEKADVNGLNKCGAVIDQLYFVLLKLRQNIWKLGYSDPYQKRALVICGNSGLQGQSLLDYPALLY